MALNMDQAISNVHALTEDQINQMIKQCDFIIEEYAKIMQRYAHQSCRQRALDKVIKNKQTFTDELTRREG